MRRRRIISAIACGWLVSSTPPCAGYKSPQQSSYNPYKYDLGNVMFTPDGRLLQVEYATIAATAYSTPICLVRLTDDLVLLACPAKKVPTSNRGSSTAVSVMDRLIVLQPQQPQPAITAATGPKDDAQGEEEAGTSTSRSSVVVVATSGVLPDGLALLQQLQGDLLKDVLYFGGRHIPTPLYVAESLADYFQRNCLNGGVRPYGAMVWTIGFGGHVDISSATTGQVSRRRRRRHLEILQTSPSGGIVQLHLPDEGDTTTPLILGVGGNDGQELVRELKKILSSVVKGNDDHRHVASTIGRVAKLLTSGETEPELMLLSSSRGALKLNKEQIRSYVRQLG